MIKAVIFDNDRVIEDTAKGIASAKAAGMKCVAFRTEYTRFQDLSAADMVVGSLTELSVAGLQKI